MKQSTVTTAQPGEGQLTWRGAIGEVWRSAARHKLAAAIVALAVVGSLAGITLATGSGSGSGSGRPLGSDPAAAAFRLPVLGHSRQQVSLADYPGRPVIVNFFASWCVPCRKETPLMARYYQSAHGTVRVIGVDTNDSETAALAFTKNDGVSYPVASDPAATTAGAFGVTALPQTFFLNAQHKIVDRVYGAVTTASLAKGVALMESR